MLFFILYKGLVFIFFNIINYIACIEHGACFATTKLRRKELIRWGKDSINCWDNLNLYRLEKFCPNDILIKIFRPFGWKARMTMIR